MKFTINKKDIIAIIASLAVGVGSTLCYQYFAANRPRIVSTTQVSASSSLYQSVRRNDLHYLHKIGNRKAELANAQAKRLNYTVYGSTIGKTVSDMHPIYHHDKHGNYWSYFEDHLSIMPNDPNFDSSEDSGGPTKFSNSNSGILANEKVLENHGIHSGVNFSYWINSNS